jgi:hypothetical protein
MPSHTRREHSPEFKAAMVLELLTGKAGVAQLAKRYRLIESMVSTSRAAFSFIADGARVIPGGCELDVQALEKNDEPSYSCRKGSLFPHYRNWGSA